MHIIYSHQYTNTKLILLTFYANLMEKGSAAEGKMNITYDKQLQWLRSAELACVTSDANVEDKRSDLDLRPLEPAGEQRPGLLGGSFAAPQLAPLKTALLASTAQRWRLRRRGRRREWKWRTRQATATGGGWRRRRRWKRRKWNLWTAHQP
jgi:hypothetical protein